MVCVGFRCLSPFPHSGSWGEDLSDTGPPFLSHHPAHPSCSSHLTFLFGFVFKRMLVKPELLSNSVRLAGGEGTRGP